MERQQKYPVFNKARRDVIGGQRGDGNQRTEPVRRPDPRTIHIGKPDPNLTGVAGLVAFGAHLYEQGVDHTLDLLFDHLKDGAGVIYRMGTQLRLLIDLFVIGEFRVFGLEAAAGDPLFVRLCGGVVPSLDTVYRDLRRFDDGSINILEELVANQGLALLGKQASGVKIHVDVDTTVEPVFDTYGSIEGAEVGYNPQYHGRPSYHPLLIRVAETDTVVGAVLRPGNTTFGAAEVPAIVRGIKRVRTVVGPDALLYVRIDSAGDCAEVMKGIVDTGSFFNIKAKMDPHLMGAIAACKKWKTVDRDVNGRPVRQVAEIKFAREEWTKQGLDVRVIAVRTRDRDHGSQLYLWDDQDYTVEAYLTNDTYSDADDVAQDYNGRAGIEPLIGEFKSHWGIGKVSSTSFDANHATLLLKLLTHNLLRRYVTAKAPSLKRWRASWLRRVLINVPGRLAKAGRKLLLHMAPRPAFTPQK